MIIKDEARNLAMAKILTNWNVEGDEPVILDSYTIEKDFGWVFFWSSRRYEETQNLKYSLAGNAPIIVNRYDGSTHYTGTALTSEHYIREYEAKLKKAKSKI